MQRARGTPGTSWGTLPATSSQDPEPQHSPALGATPAQSWDVKPAKVTMGWGEQSQFLFSLFFFCFYPLICTVVYSGIGASLVAQTVKIYLQCRRPGGERSLGGGHGKPLQYSCQGQRSLVGYRWKVYLCLLKCWFSLDVYPAVGLLGLKVLLYFVKNLHTVLPSGSPLYISNHSAG